MQYILTRPWRTLLWFAAFVFEYIFLLMAVSHDATIRPIGFLLLAGIACTIVGMWAVHLPAVMLAGGRSKWLAHLLKSFMLFVAWRLLWWGGVILTNDLPLHPECQRLNPFIRAFESCGDENYFAWRFVFGLVAFVFMGSYAFAAFSQLWPKRNALLGLVAAVIALIVFFWPSEPQDREPYPVVTTPAAASINGG